VRKYYAEYDVAREFIRDIRSLIDSPECSALDLQKRSGILSRKAWYSAVDPSSSKDTSELNRAALGEMFPEIGAVLLRDSSLRKNGSAAQVSAPTLEEFLKTNEMKKTSVFGLGYVTAPSCAAIFSSLTNRKDNYVVVALMSRGYGYAAKVEATLKAKGKSSGFALMGYSTGCYSQHYFEDGSPLHNGKVHILEEDLCFLERNKDKPAIIADDVAVTGETSTKVADALKKMGFKEVFRVMSDEPKFLYV
jgi:hypothetical protein